MTDHLACISLTNFVNEGRSITGNGNYVNLQKLAWKNSWNHFGRIYFRRVLASWNHALCRRTSSSSAVGAYIASIAFSCAASQTSEDWSEYGTGTHIAEAIDDGGRRRPFRLEDIYCSWEKQDHSCSLATSIGNSLLLVTEFFYTIWHNIDRQLSPQQQRCVQWRCWSLL